MTAPLTRQADELLAMVGETTDDELLEATRALRAVSVEHDEVNARFEAAANVVRRLLLVRMVSTN